MENQETKSLNHAADGYLFDKEISLKAKGLLTQLSHLPNEANVNQSALCAMNKESVESIRSAIKELESYGYLSRDFSYENGIKQVRYTTST